MVIYDGTRFQIINPVPSSGVSVSDNNTWTGTQTFRDNKFEITDDSDTTKKAAYELSGIGTGTTKTQYIHAASDAHINGFRLTLTTVTPVTTSNVTAAGTIYACPYKGRQIALYDGSNWNIRTSAEFSLAISGLTSGKPYDVFCYDNSGTPTLEFLVWTNDTTRATALAYQDGVLVKSGAATRRYLGTFYTTSTTTSEDSETKRFLYNYYHRVRRTLNKTDSTASWTYTTASYRQANNAAANQVEAIQGVAEDAVFIDVRFSTSLSSGFSSCPAGIGIDSTTVSSHTKLSTLNGVFSAASGFGSAEYRGVPAAGYHKYVWLEYGAANTTFLGGSNSSGISGEVMA